MTLVVAVLWFAEFCTEHDLIMRRDLSVAHGPCWRLAGCALVEWKQYETGTQTHTQARIQNERATHICTYHSILLCARAYLNLKIRHLLIMCTLQPNRLNINFVMWHVQKYFHHILYIYYLCVFGPQLFYAISRVANIKYSIIFWPSGGNHKNS